MFTAGWIAPCGLDCSLCAAAQAKTDPCPGCRGPNRNKPVFCAEKCGIIRCERRKENGYVFCDECPVYPCPDVMEKETRYTSHYPLCESPMQNLKDIREKGMEAFLEEERGRWTCDECGGPVCVHTGTCADCGKKTGAHPVRLDRDTWCIGDGGVRFFLLAGRERALLIDSGMTVPHARELAEHLTGLPVSLLNTHSDRDHTGGNGHFESFYMHPADEAQYRETGGKGTVLPVRDGEEMDLGGRLLRIIHLPGHTPGSIAVLDVDRRVLISGDPIQQDGQIFLFGKNRNMRDYVRSLEKLAERTGEFDRIWPSHASFPLTPDCIGRLLEGARQVLEGKRKGTERQVHGSAVTAYDLGHVTLLCDR